MPVYSKLKRGDCRQSHEVRRKTPEHFVRLQPQEILQLCLLSSLSFNFRTNCESFANKIIFDIKDATQTPHTISCIRGDSQYCRIFQKICCYDVLLIESQSTFQVCLTASRPSSAAAAFVVARRKSRWRSRLTTN